MSDLYPVVVEKALDIMNREYQNQDLTLDTISKSVFVNKYHLCRIFKKTMGITIHEYLFIKRISYFKIFATQNPQEPLSLLLQKSGFVSYRSLSHYLKTHYQTTVTDFITNEISIR